MFYVLNDSVYLVNGYARSCIYDFNSLKLYSINKPLAQKIDLANHGELSPGSLDKELNEIFDEFIKLKILAISNTPIVRQIDEIKSPDLGIKFAWIEVTNKCNLRCRHCYNESDAQNSTTMSLHDYKIVIDSLLALNVRKVQIIGGEPFFDKFILKDMLDYTIGKFPIIEIFTNGTLISSDWIDYFAENHIHIALSVYSYNPQMHDNVTGFKGSWAKTNKIIEDLKNHNISYRVCNVLMKDVEIGESTTNLYELSHDKDIVRMSGRANFRLLSDDLIRTKLITKKSFQNGIKKTFCGLLVAGHNCFRNRLYISADMTVFPCVMERRLQHCVLNKKTGIILDDSIRHFNKDRIHECSLCEYRYACFDCRPNSLSGDLLEKPWYCTYKPIHGEWENEDDFIENLKIKWG